MDVVWGALVAAVVRLPHRVHAGKEFHDFNTVQDGHSIHKYFLFFTFEYFLFLFFCNSRITFHFGNHSQTLLPLLLMHHHLKTTTSGQFPALAYLANHLTLNCRPQNMIKSPKDQLRRGHSSSSSLPPNHEQHHRMYVARGVLYGFLTTTP